MALTNTSTMKVREALGSTSDLTNDDTTQKYPLGSIIEVYDDAYYMAKKFIYVKAHATLAKGYGLFVTFKGTSGGEVTTVEAATSSIPQLPGGPRAK